MKKSVRAMIVIENAGTTQVFLEEFVPLAVKQVNSIASLLPPVSKEEAVAKIKAELAEDGSISTLKSINFAVALEMAQIKKMAGDWILKITDEEAEVEHFRRDHWNDRLSEMNFNGQSINVLNSAPAQ